MKRSIMEKEIEKQLEKTTSDGSSDDGMTTIWKTLSNLICQKKIIINRCY